MEKNKKLAVIRVSGKQYKVTEGVEILVDKLSDLKTKPEVLLYSDGASVRVGNPLVRGAEVKFTVIKELEKGEKIKGFKYKSKSRYRKRYGFRHSYTRLKVDKIEM